MPPGLFCYAHVQKSKGGAKNGLLFLILNTAFEQKRQTLEHFFLPNIMRKSKLILITS